jgi:hypothetical protein
VSLVAVGKQEQEQQEQGNFAASNKAKVGYGFLEGLLLVPGTL